MGRVSRAAAIDHIFFRDRARMNDILATIKATRTYRSPYAPEQRLTG
jgi:hypothetical protein